MADYSEQLDLDFDPFDTDSEIGHFFPGGNRQEALDQLVELISYSSDLVAVTGPLGCGKSTLAQWLAQSLEDRFVAVRIQATLFMSPEQLLETLCQELGLDTAPDAGVDDLVSQLDDYADSLHARSRVLVLLVDDAHELGEDALAALLDLVERQADPSRLGDDGIKATLLGENMLLDSMEKLAPSAYQALALDSLSRAETLDYLEFKLGCAGHTGSLPIDSEIIALIHSRSRGLPGAIDTLARGALADALADRPVRPELGFAERHLVGFSVLFGSVVLVLFFTLGGERGAAPGPGASSSPSLVAGSSAEPGQQRVRVPLNLPGGSPASGTDNNGGAVNTPAAAIRSVPSAGQPATRDTALLPSAAPGSAAPASAASVEDRSASDSGAVAVQPAASDSRAAAIPPAPGASPAASAAGVAALLARSPESYTLQLLGSHSEANVRDFIARQADQNELAYFQSRHQERPWFVVVYGHYPNRDAAREAAARLPAALRDLQPWVRSLSEIQADIRRYH